MTDTAFKAGKLVRRDGISSRMRIGSLGVPAILCVLSFPLIGLQTPGQPAKEPSAAELAKQTQNPVAGLISVPFQSNSQFGLGDRSATGSLMNFQPVVPFAINSSTNIILRVIMPLSSQPASDGMRINGLGDTVASAFFSPSKFGKVIWGAGPVFLLPTASQKQLGAEKFGVGPTAVALVQPGRWTLGALANQIWSTSGAIDRASVNRMFLQPFANYNVGNGLAFGLGMEASTDWKAAEKVTAPLLFSVSKVTMLGRRPVNLAAAAGPYVFSPHDGPSWLFRVSATFLYPR